MVQEPPPPPDPEAPSVRPWRGLGLAAAGLPVALVSLLLIAALVFGDGAVPAWLYGLLGIALLTGYAGVWLLLRASTPRSLLLRLALGLGSALSIAWGLGVPALVLALALIVLGVLVVLTSGPILLHGLVRHQDEAARRRSRPDL
jgi:hypothetical protein